MKTLTTFYRRLVFLFRFLDEPIPLLESRLPVSVSLLAGKDLPTYQSFRSDQDLKDLQARLTRGHQCYVSWHEGRIVNAMWLATGRVHIPYFRRDLILERGDVFRYDSYTSQAYRGYALYPAKVTYVMRRSKEEGYLRNVAVVAMENKTPIAVLKRLGAKPAGLYSCVRLGPWQRVWQESWGEESLPKMV